MKRLKILSKILIICLLIGVMPIQIFSLSDEPPEEPWYSDYEPPEYKYEYILVIPSLVY